ncbi:MAG: Methyltransferase family protein [Streptosporangiaceae bacterium]|nr:Methyltransferase family protein [Streptosporangiaceae bacterium]
MRGGGRAGATAGWRPADRRAILRRRRLGDLPVYLTGNLIGLAALGAEFAECLTGGRARRLSGTLCGSAMVAAACAQPYLGHRRDPALPARPPWPVSPRSRSTTALPMPRPPPVTT